MKKLCILLLLIIVFAFSYNYSIIWTLSKFGTIPVMFKSSMWNDIFFDKSRGEVVYKHRPSMIYSALHDVEICNMSRGEIHRILGPSPIPGSHPEESDSYGIGITSIFKEPVSLEIYYAGDRVIRCGLEGP